MLAPQFATLTPTERNTVAGVERAEITARNPGSGSVLVGTIRVQMRLKEGFEYRSYGAVATYDGSGFRMVTLWQTRAILPTCELHIRTVPGASQEWPFDLAARICRLLSVAAGTVIEWIVAEGVDEHNERTRCVHAARRTKPFCSLPVVPIKEFSYGANTRLLQEYLQIGLEKSKALGQHSMNRLIASFLDARLESDDVEARGIKTVVVLETLKNLFSEEYSTKEWETLLPKALRKKISNVVKSALDQNDIPSRAANAVQDVIGQLDRPTFKRLLTYMIEQLGLIEDENILKAIIFARNQLVHTGQFVSTKDAVKAKALGFIDATHEFFNLLSFVDRILLRVLGHEGLYTNYSACSMDRFSPVIQELPMCHK